MDASLDQLIEDQRVASHFYAFFSLLLNEFVPSLIIDSAIRSAISYIFRTMSRPVHMSGLEVLESVLPFPPFVYFCGSTKCILQDPMSLFGAIWGPVDRPGLCFAP